MIHNLRQHDCRTELNDADLRATPARLAVMKLLEQAATPVDVQNVIEHLQKEHIDTDPATAFRIMNMFTEKGITKQVSFNEGKFRYELANKPDHHHLVCTQCGGVEDFSDCAIPDLERDIHKKKQFLVTAHALEFYGICSSCANKKGVEQSWKHFS